MNIFDIGSHIESLNLSDEEFSRGCKIFLEKEKIDLSLEEIESSIFSWSLESQKLPDQVNVYNGFGQPPVTIFNNSRFVVDIYFWQTLDTSIHSHSFCGAFQVLFGESRHEVFRVQKEKEYFPDIFQGSLDCITDEVLYKNDIREIKRGLEFSHRVLHQHNPTVTLCIRTINDKSPQWHHFENGLSIQKSSPESCDIKRLSIFDYLYSKDEEEAQIYLEQLMEQFSASLMMNLYEQLSYDQMGLREESVEAFFSAVVERYGDDDWFKSYMSMW